MMDTPESNARAHRTPLRAALLAAALVALTSCTNPRADTEPADGTAADLNDGSGVTVVLGDTFPGLHNVFVVGPMVYSGSGPDTPEAFDSLAGLGVKTVISVDGALPEVGLAHERGMRYVHVPIGYDGLERGQVVMLARALRDMPGPVYFHCHHGKHRGPTGAAVAMIGLGRMTNEQAVDFLAAAGTSESYPGLWACVREATPLSDAVLDAAPGGFPEQQRVSGLVDGMVAIDAAWERVKLIRAAGWKAPDDHPDLAPAAETGALADHFRVLVDDPDTKAEGPEFIEMMRRAMERASALEASFTRIAHEDAFSERAFLAVESSCNECHKRWRN